MKKRLLLLLCLLVTAGSAVWADIASGNCKNGTWKIDDNGKLTVTMTGKMADYGEGKAPWYGYADQITAIHIGSGATNVGRNGFYGLTKVKSVMGGENVEAVAMYGFEECGADGMIPEIYLPKCTYLGECSFRGCGAVRIILPVVEEVRMRAFCRSPYLMQIDLGSKIETIGALAFSECPRMWYDDSPNIFMSNPTPPTVQTLIEASAADKVKAFFKDAGKALAVGLMWATIVGAPIVVALEAADQKAWDKKREEEGLAFEQPYERFFELDDLKDKYYNPFYPRPDGAGWDGEPIVCVPYNLVETYRNRYEGCDGCIGYYKEEHDYDSYHWGTILPGGYMNQEKREGWWYMAPTGKTAAELGSGYYENKFNDLCPYDVSIGGELIPASKFDGLCFGSDAKTAGTSTLNSLKNQIRNLYIGNNSTFPAGIFENWTKLEYVNMGYGSQISDRMFKGCTNLTTVNAELKSIGEQAFMDCKKLFSFIGGAESVGTEAFRNCVSIQRFGNDILKYIGPRAFMGCTSLVKINSYNGYSSYDDIKTIGESAFEGCVVLEDISLRNVQELGKRAFYGCYMPNVQIERLATIPEEAFANCRTNRLTFASVVSNGIRVSSIGSKAFDNCVGLHGKDIYVEYRAPEVASDAFNGLTLDRITLHATPEVYNSGYETDPVWGKMKVNKNYDEQSTVGSKAEGWVLSNGTLTVTRSFTTGHPESMPWYSYREYIKRIVIEEVTGINDYEFAGLENVVSVSIPRSVSNIGEGAFKGCSSLENIYITRVEKIGSYAFEDCSSLETIEINEELKRAGDYIFRNCISLKDIRNYCEDPAIVTDLTFKGIKSSAYQLRHNGGAMYAQNDGGQSTVTLKVPSSAVTKYMVDKNWNKFHIPYADGRGTWQKAGYFGDGMWILYDDGTMVISADKGPGDNYDESSWTALGFDSEVASKTKALEFKGNIEYLSWCFNDFTELESVKLCPSIKTLDGTFYNNEKLSSINLQNVETIGQSTFYNTALANLDLSGVKTLGKYAFDNCQKLTDVKLGGDCKVGSHSFQGCSSLVAVDLGGANLDEAKDCFNHCSKLKMIKYNGHMLPEGIFEDCSSLKSIMLGSNVESIKWSAFEGCTSLDTIYCDSPTPPMLPLGEKQIFHGDVDYELVDAWAFDGLNKSDIKLFVMPDLIPLYRKANIWKEMNIIGDEEYTEPLLPTGGSVGEFGTWELDETACLTIDCEGKMPAFDELGASTWSWCRTFDRWAAYIEWVRYTDKVTYIPQNITNKDAEQGLYDKVQSLEIGCNVDTIRENAMRYTGLTDVYCFAPEPPFIVTSEENGTFDKAAILARGTTLHVVDFQGTLEKYKKSYRWNWFPKIVADLPTRKPGTIMVEKVNVSSPTGTWLSVRSSELGSTTVQLEANVYPANAANTALVWTSEDESVATVDANGLVTIIGYPDMMEVGITATAADGSNRKGTVSLRIVNPENDWGSVLCEGMDVDRKTITIMKSQQTPATITVQLTPANSTANIDFDVVDNSLIQVEAEYDNASGRRTGVFHISAPDPMMMPEIRTGSTLIHFYTHYYDEATLGVNYPEVWVNVNVIEDVRFTEETVQYVPVTYAVTSLEGGTCTVYGEWVDGHDENGTWVDGGYNTAIDQSTTGLVTVPNKARNYYVTGVDGSAFAECSRLEEVEFESGIKFIGNSAFTGCSNLREVLLPETIEAFGYGSFSNLPSLKDVHILATTPPTGGGIYVGNPWSWPAIGDSYAFSGLTGATLHVPAGCSEAYNISPWNVWFSTITEDAADGIETIDHSPLTIDHSGGWFDLSGRKLTGKPAQPGLYINGGRKVVIK